jgi:hypothetical protein
MKNLLITILTWWSGKKSSIIAIIALIITLALTKGWIDDAWAICLNGILLILGGGASYATSKLVFPAEKK